MGKILNKYGDKLIQTTGSHGADISAQRMDDLDKKALKYVLRNAEKNLKGLDAGCGYGIQSVRFALLHVEMHLIDMLDMQQRIRNISKNLFLTNKLIYIQKDIKEINATDLPPNIDFVYSQRFIHYLTYDEAKTFVSTISKLLKKKGVVFISASGIHSELGTNYKGNNLHIEKRYCKLSPSIASKHNILEKVCLYSKEELSALLRENKLMIQEIWESPFGNIKAIAVKQ